MRLATKARRGAPASRSLPVPISVATTETEDPLAVEIEGLRYELDRPPSRSGRKVIVTVRRVGVMEGPPLVVDRIDIYSAKARGVLARHMAEQHGLQEGRVAGELNYLLDHAERLSGKCEKRKGPVVLDGPRTKKAEELLLSPGLLDLAALALEQSGYVGEESTKRLVYLVGTSRLLPQPLSGIIFAPSGSGKSELLDRLVELLPAEGVEYLSRLTPQALFYAGSDHLRHKLVVVDEQAGATEADYAIRTLQTKGLLRLAIPVKGKTESFEARGPIALLSGTTREDLNPENLSRCLELTLDDGEEQTRRVQDAQRRSCAGERGEAVDRVAWQDAQRLLEPLGVVIPFATSLGYPSRTTKDRRDNQKLLSLVMAHALLHQRQRARDARGRIVARVSDYEAVYRLLRPLVERAVDGLSPRAATLYRELAGAGSGAALTRREVARKLGWPYMTAARTLAELASQELVRVDARARPLRYELLDRSLLGTGIGLTAPGDLAKRQKTRGRGGKGR